MSTAIAGRVLTDHDFHPDEPAVRIFRTPPAGVLWLDDSVAITEADYGGTVLRHYAFASHWFKVNVTTDRGGRLTETGDPTRRFAVNCDIATPMEREGPDAAVPRSFGTTGVIAPSRPPGHYLVTRTRSDWSWPRCSPGWGPGHDRRGAGPARAAG